MRVMVRIINSEGKAVLDQPIDLLNVKEGDQIHVSRKFKFEGRTLTAVLDIEEPRSGRLPVAP